jgi:O-antigen ligase
MNSHDTDARRGVGAPAMTRGLLLSVAACCFFSIALMQMLLGLAFVNWTVGLVRWGRAEVRGPLTLWMAGFILLSVISAANAGDAHSMKKALSGGMPMLAYWMVLNTHTRRGHLERALTVLVSVGVAAALLGLAQSWTERSGYRIRGSLSHYMTYSGVLMMAASAALSGAVFAARKRWLASLALVPLLAALLLTQTRGAWVGLAAGGLVVLALRRARLMIVIPVVALGCYLLAPAHVQARIRSTVDLEDTTARERLVMWGVGGRMIADHPLLGVGPSLTQASYDQYRPTDDPFAEIEAMGHLHNNLVQLTAERGLLGSSLWLIFWGAWFVLVARRYRCLETAFQTMGLFEFNAGDSEVATLAFFLMGLPLGFELASGYAGDEVAIDGEAT